MFSNGLKPFFKNACFTLTFQQDSFVSECLKYVLKMFAVQKNFVKDIYQTLMKYSNIDLTGIVPIFPLS